MDARKHAWALAVLALLSVAARYQTPNFVVTAPTPEMAQQIGQAAEKYRREIARDWLGYVMPEWSKPCPVTVRIERGAGGVTTFNFAKGLKSEDWTTVTQQHYGYRGLGELQNSWLDWVSKGCPGMDYAETSIAMRLASGRVAANTSKANGGKDAGGKEGSLVYRGQS